MVENDVKMASPLLTKLQISSASSNGHQFHQSNSVPSSVLLVPGRHNEQIISMENHYHSNAERVTLLTEVEMADLVLSNTNLNNVQILNRILDCMFCAFFIEKQNNSKYLLCLRSSPAMCWNHMLCNANYMLIEEFSFLKPEYRHRMVQFIAEAVKMSIPSVDSSLSNLFRALSDGTEFVETCKLAISVAQILNTNQQWLIGLKKNSLVLADAFAFMARFINDVPLVTANAPLIAVDSFKSSLISICELLIRERFADLAAVMGRDLMISLMRLSKLAQFQNVWKALLHNPTSLLPNYSLKQLMMTLPTDKFLGSRVSVNVSRKIEHFFGSVRNQLRNKDFDFDFHFNPIKDSHLSGPDSGTMHAEIIRHVWALLKQEELGDDFCEARALLLVSLLRSAKIGAERQWCTLMLFWDWFGFESRLVHLEPAFTTVRIMLQNFSQLGNALVDFLIRETQILCPQLNAFFVQSITKAFRVLERAFFSIHNVLAHQNLDQQLKDQFRSFFSDLFPKKVTALANNLAEPSTIIDFDAIRNISTASIEGKATDPNKKDSLTEGQGQSKKTKLIHNTASKEKPLPTKQMISHKMVTNLKKHLNEGKTQSKEHPQPIRKRKRPKSKDETNGPIEKKAETADLYAQNVVHPDHSPAVASTSGTVGYDSWTTAQNEREWESQQQGEWKNEGNDEEDNINKMENLLPMVREEFREHLEELDEAIRQRRYSKAEKEVRALADTLFDADEFDKEQEECISLCLLHIFLKNEMRRGPIVNDSSNNNSSFGHPIFILFRVITHFDDNTDACKSLLNILAKMRKECACVGYLFLTFMCKAENEKEEMGGQSEAKRVADTYKSFCESTEESILEEVLVKDMEKCSFDNVNLFTQILPCVLSNFFSYGSPHKLLRVICATIDPRQLSQLISEIVRENIVLFVREEILVLLFDSLKWESMEQFMLWQLVQVEAVELDKFLDLLQRLNYVQHPEATAAILVILRNMEPNLEPAVMRSLLKNLFLRQPDRDLFTVDALKLIVDYSDNIPPMSDCISKMVKQAIHNNEIFAPAGQAKLGKARPKVLLVENIIDHLDRFRRHCSDRESKGVENWLNNALTLELFRALKSHPKLLEIRSRFAELFALFDTLLDAKKEPKEGVRHRRGRKGKSGQSSSSKSCLDLEPFDGPSFKKRKKIVQQSDSEDSE